MRHWSIALLGLVVPCFTFVPSFDINLDDVPQKRWQGVTKFYRKELIHILHKTLDSLDDTFGDRLSAWDSIPFEPEHLQELEGIVAVVADPVATVQSLRYYNMLYEMQDPTACSGVLWANQQNGTVIHGRNLDFVFNKSKYSKNVAWQHVTYDAHLYKGGKKLMSMTQWPGIIGIHTAMRLSDGPNTGWSFEQNTRRPNYWKENLEAASRGGQIFTIFARKVMEETPDYATAVNRLAEASFAAPQYFVISGSGPYEGSVLTIDRLSQHSLDSPPRQHVSNSSIKGSWHLVQTNDDLLQKAEDGRRTLANWLLDNSPSMPSPDNMMSFMHTTMLLNMDTVFTTVMVPAFNYYKSVLPRDNPKVLDGEDLSKRIQKTMAENAAIAKMESKMAAKMQFNSMTGQLLQVGRKLDQNDTAAKDVFRSSVPDEKTSLVHDHTDSHSGGRRQRRFLARPAAAISSGPDDEASFLQLSWKLET